MSEEKALHFSSGKLGLDQLDVEFLCEMALVLNFGEYKYERDNWKQGSDYHEIFGSIFRHYAAFALGENLDTESGLSHLAHIAIDAMFLFYWEQNGVGFDDRPERNSIPKIIRERLEDTIATAKELRQQREEKTNE